MGAQATTQALAMAGCALQDIDLIINASATQHRLIPDGGPMIQRALGIGASGIPAFSIHSTCLSFLFAVELVASLLSTGRYRCILVVSSEIASVGLNFDDPFTASLFGDGAAAVVFRLPDSDETGSLIQYHFETYGDSFDLSTIRLGTERNQFRENFDPTDVHFKMDGKRLYRFARKRLGPFFTHFSPGWPDLVSDIAAVISHQTTRHGLLALTHHGIPEELIVMTLSKLGNCVAASIPMTLYEAIVSGRIQEGDRFLLFGPGAGFSLGAALMEY